MRRSAGFVGLFLLACGGDDRSVPAGAIDASTDAVTQTMSCSGCRVIRHVRVIDVDGVRDDRRVMIDGQSIRSDEPDDGSVVTGAAEEIDATGKSLLPGLWDVHVHLLVSAEGPQQSGEYTEQHLRGYLYSGVTTIVDVGADRTKIFPLRSELAAGSRVGPSLRAVGPAFTVAGGHPCTTFSDPNQCLVVDGATSVPALMDALAPDEPDLVKLVIDDGPNSAIQLGRMTPEEAQAVVTAASAHGHRAIAHVSSTADVTDAVAAGVHALAHAPGEDILSDDVVGAIADKDVAVVTTLSVYAAPRSYLDQPSYLDEPLVVGAVPPEVIATLKSPGVKSFLGSPEGSGYVNGTWAFYQTASQTVSRLRARGAKILAGSDAGNFMTFHGPALHRELELLVAAGLSPLEAIASATAAPARFFGVESEHGRIATGYRADLVLIDGDPSVDIRVTRNVESVWKHGVPLDRNALRAAP